jgi:signal transduction histidine kinase
MGERVLVAPRRADRPMKETEGIMPKRNQGRSQTRGSLLAQMRSGLARLIDGFSSIRAKLVLPYMLLTLLLAFGGIYIVTRLVTSSVRERFVNQLYEAGRVAADGIVRREEGHLSSLRLMTFTVGVPEGMVNRDQEGLSSLLTPLALNDDLEAVIVVGSDGQEILGLTRTSSDEPFQQTSGSDFSSYDFVSNVLAGTSDQQGDKFVGLIDTSVGTFLFTSAPVLDSSGETIGAILAGTHAETLARVLKSQALADIVLLDQQQDLIASTFVESGGDINASDLIPAQIPSGSAVSLREFSMFGRPYQAAYSPWIVRDQVLGSLGVVLPSNFVVSAEATSRNVFSLVFSIGTLAVIVVGFVLSQNIANPILRLREMAQAVAAGDLEQASGLRRSDEIGDLATAFDTMTARLQSRTEEANRLYQETVERNRQLAEMYDRLQAAQQQLIQSEKLAAVGQLAAGIVHDVKNPLGVIKGMAEELMLDADGQPDMQQGLTIIRDNASRANLIVTDMLKFARQSTPTMQQRDLRTTLEGCLRLTDYLIRKGKVTAETDFPDKPIWVTYDAQQIEQVVINLIQNAVQAMPEGGALTLAVTEDDGDVLLRIEDSGKGIEAENLSRIFEPFFTTKPEGQGTGMGLAVSYGIISRHGGRIDVESEVGVGTAFSIRLPREPVPELREQEVTA